MWFQTLPGIKKSSVSRCQRQQQPFINENSCGMAPISFSTKNIFTCSCTFQWNVTVGKSLINSFTKKYWKKYESYWRVNNSWKKLHILISMNTLFTFVLYYSLTIVCTILFLNSIYIKISYCQCETQIINNRNKCYIATVSCLTKQFFDIFVLLRKSAKVWPITSWKTSIGKSLSKIGGLITVVKKFDI